MTISQDRYHVGSYKGVRYLKQKKKFFSEAYKIDKQEDIDLLYTHWSQTYDEELHELGYQSPIRCASALAKFVAFDTPVLDFGCGTGLSGEALKKVGFQNIFATEINKDMRDIATQKQIYKHFYTTNKNNPYPAATKFSGVCAVGVISSGAGPPSLLRQSLNCLVDGGFICFSYNDHTLKSPRYMDSLEDVQKFGEFEEVFSEYGPHLSSKGLSSQVYVFRKSGSR